MNEYKPSDKTEVISRQTDTLRKQAMARVAAYCLFLEQHPEINPDLDEDLTDDQATDWEELSSRLLEREK